MYLPDPFETWENSAEDWHYLNVKDGIAKCGCGRAFELEKGYQINSFPWGVPVCEHCYNEACHQSVMDHIHSEIDRANQAPQTDQAGPAAIPPSDDV